jgi:hypothetical protein
MAKLPSISLRDVKSGYSVTVKLLSPPKQEFPESRDYVVRCLDRGDGLEKELSGPGAAFLKFRDYLNSTGILPEAPEASDFSIKVQEDRNLRRYFIEPVVGD